MPRMITEDAGKFLWMLKPGRLFGLDVGEKTVGLALSDPGRMIASPFETLTRARFSALATRLAALFKEHGAAGLVIGLPLNMNGTEGPRAQATRQFAANLEPHVPLPMLLWDERLSTAAVERAMLEADLSRDKRKKQVDKLAATYILQGCLDFIKNPPASSARGVEAGS